MRNGLVLILLKQKYRTQCTALGWDRKESLATGHYAREVSLTTACMKWNPFMDLGEGGGGGGAK